jgi:hypothetical protein
LHAQTAVTPAFWPFYAFPHWTLHSVLGKLRFAEKSRDARRLTPIAP